MEVDGDPLDYVAGSLPAVASAPLLPAAGGEPTWLETDAALRIYLRCCGLLTQGRRGWVYWRRVCQGSLGLVCVYQVARIAQFSADPEAHGCPDKDGACLLFFYLGELTGDLCAFGMIVAFLDAHRMLESGAAALLAREVPAAVARRLNVRARRRMRVVLGLTLVVLLIYVSATYVGFANGQYTPSSNTSEDLLAFVTVDSVFAPWLLFFFPLATFVGLSSLCIATMLFDLASRAMVDSLDVFQRALSKGEFASPQAAMAEHLRLRGHVRLQLQQFSRVLVVMLAGSLLVTANVLVTAVVVSAGAAVTPNAGAPGLIAFFSVLAPWIVWRCVRVNDNMESVREALTVSQRFSLEERHFLREDLAAAPVRVEIYGVVPDRALLGALVVGIGSSLGNVVAG